MYVLQNCYILDYLDLPTIPWMQCQTDTRLDDSILWTVKNEPFYGVKGYIYGKIGVTASEAMDYIKSQYETMERHRMLLCYPYFTASKSGTIDMTYERVAIEAVEGKIENLKKKHRVDETLLFREEDLEIFGEEEFLTRDETLEIIDYGCQLKKRFAGELEFGKNIIIYWSYVEETLRNMIPKGNPTLVFHQIKVLGA